MPAGLSWEPHPDVWLLIIALVGGYLSALSAWGPQAAPGRPAATRGQRLCFFAGVVVLWVGADWPVHELAEDYLFSVHMVQHMLFMYVAAPLLILGVPGWLWRRLLGDGRVFAVANHLTRPVVALAIVTTYLAVTHWPAMIELQVSNGLVHVALHTTLVGVSLIMWWPVLSPLPELPHLSYPGQMAYLFAHSIMPTVPASFLTFSHHPLYEAYAQAPRLWAFMTPVQDQQVAGLIMKIGGGLLLWAVIAVLFFRWAAESASGGPDTLYWRDVQGDTETTTLIRQ